MGKKEGVVEEVEEKITPAWHAMTVEEVKAELGLPADVEKTGITDEDAAARLEKYGPNALTEKKKRTLLQKIWEQVANVLVGILVFVAVISFIRVFTDDPTTNAIQVGIIFGVIMYVIFHWMFVIPLGFPFKN